jgi:hypothetical protein
MLGWVEPIAKPIDGFRCEIEQVSDLAALPILQTTDFRRSNPVLVRCPGLLRGARNGGERPVGNGVRWLRGLSTSLRVKHRPSAAPATMQSSRVSFASWIASRLVMTLIAIVALLFPRIASVVIAADFPIARLVGGEEFDALQPFRALPEIQVRHHQAHRAAVIGFDRCA